MITIMLLIMLIALLAGYPLKMPLLLATLAARGFGAREREWLRERVETARRVVVPGGAAGECAGETDPTLGAEGSAPAAGSVSALGADVDAERDEVMRSFLALRRWYADWSLTAKAIVVRRDWLVRMGGGRRGVAAVSPSACAPAATCPRMPAIRQISALPADPRRSHLHPSLPSGCPHRDR